MPIGARSLARMKFALVSYHLPPSPSGQSMVLYRLLRGFEANSYCLITSNNYEGDEGQENSDITLAGRLFRLPPVFQITRGYRYGLAKLRETINIPFAILLRARQIVNVVRSENCRAIVACTGGPDLMDLPAAYLASRIVGVPFYPYYFDDYYYQWSSLTNWEAIKGRHFARGLEWALIRGAERVIVPNEFMGAELMRRYGIETTVIHNSCDLAENEGEVNGVSSASDEVKIVYTGAVYEAHFDAFLNLIEALKLLGRADLSLHIYTSNSHSDLLARGIRGPVVYHEHLNLSEIRAIHREADLLFLPLAFNSPYPELVKTSAPGKLGEYLAAGRPVLAHAPTDSFVVWYLRQHGCGVVVDENNPRELASAVERILNDEQLQQQLASRARVRASTDFNVATAQAKFVALLTDGDK